MTSTTCDCCTGAGDRTPVALGQRPGLSAIAYRVGAHADFLASMLAGLTDAKRPGLAGLTARDEDDFTIALLDAWAVVADVLTFYTERLAQESYLRTARERVSLEELGRLIGYRMRPGVAAQTLLAFAIEEQPELPAQTANEPGAAPPVTPSVVTLDRGLRVQSIPAPDEQPQTFETVERIDARPEYNAILAATTVAPGPGLDATRAWLQGAGLDLAPGDELLLDGGNMLAAGWALRTVTAVEPDAGADRTSVRWDGPLALAAPAQPDPPRPYVMRRRLDVFGHNAPLWKAMPGSFRADYLDPATQDPGDWPDFTISTAAAPSVDLDGSHPDVAPGSAVVLCNGALRELWRVATVTELSRSEFAVAGKVTRLELAGVADLAPFAAWPRATKVLAAGERLELAAATDASPVAGTAIDVDADVSAMAPGRRVIVHGVTASGVAHTESATVREIRPAGGRWQIVLRDGLSTAYERATVVVHGNVAPCTHGETVQELLGSGDARAAFQRFALAHEPLTYRRSAAASGASAELEVRVNDVRWDERATLHGAAPADRAFVVRSDEQGRTSVQFGDGVSGARLPSGSANVRAVYRKGLGRAGNVGPGTLAQLIDRPLGAKGVGNPLAAGGGADPEDASTARASIPLAVRTLGRAVSLLDYEDFSRAYAGVAKAHAAVLALRAGPTIVVTAALDGGPGDLTRFDELAAALRAHGDPHVQVAVLPYAAQTFRLALRVAVDPARETAATLRAVDAALRAAYAFDARSFAQPVHRSEVVAAVHAVAGVVAVDVDRMYRGSIPALEDRLVAQRPAAGAGGAPRPAGLLLLDSAPLDWLEAMS